MLTKIDIFFKLSDMNLMTCLPETSIDNLDCSTKARPSSHAHHPTHTHILLIKFLSVSSIKQNLRRCWCWSLLLNFNVMNFEDVRWLPLLLVFLFRLNDFSFLFISISLSTVFVGSRRAKWNKNKTFYLCCAWQYSALSNLNSIEVRASCRSCNEMEENKSVKKVLIVVIGRFLSRRNQVAKWKVKAGISISLSKAPPR